MRVKMHKANRASGREHRHWETLHRTQRRCVELEEAGEARTSLTRTVEADHTQTRAEQPLRGPGLIVQREWGSAGRRDSVKRRCNVGTDQVPAPGGHFLPVCHAGRVTSLAVGENRRGEHSDVEFLPRISTLPGKAASSVLSVGKPVTRQELQLPRDALHGVRIVGTRRRGATG